MLSDRFMSEIGKYRKQSLNETEHRFINLIGAAPCSAYHIYDFCQKEEGKKIAYKNVHKAMKGLESNGLIEKVKGRFPRRAIKYQLTTQGLYEYLSSIPTLPILMKVWKESEIIKSMVYQFFESETIDHFTSWTSMFSFNDYIKECCKSIFEEVDRHRNSKVKDEQPDLKDILDQVIRSKAKRFIIQIVRELSIKRKELYLTVRISDNRGIEHKRVNLREPHTLDSEYIYPVEALRKDKKFLKIKDEVKEELEEGFKILA